MGFAMNNLLHHEELCDTVQGVYPTTGMNVRVAIKGKIKIILLVNKINYVHIENAETSKEVWDSLKIAFQNSGRTRRVGLLREHITTNYASCESTEEYVTKFFSTTHQLKEVNMPLNDE